jgi:hypothetical protein
MYPGDRVRATQGEFERKGQTDWAVLCSRRGISMIYVFWGGSPRKYERLGEEPDRTSAEDKAVGLSLRDIGRGSAERFIISERPERHGLPNPQHDILADSANYRDDAFYYRFHGRWIKLQ